MILIIDMCNEKDSLSRLEFVDPITRAIGTEEYIIKHRTEISQEDITPARHVILSGCALIDNAFLKDIRSFSWLLDTNKKILGICAGMETLALVFGAKMRAGKEIGMTHPATT